MLAVSDTVRLRFRIPPILIIGISGIAILTLLPISDSIVGLFFVITAGLWGSLTILATDQIETRIRTNLEEMEKKGKVGRRRRLAANWPKQSMKVASRMWGVATLAFAIELGLGAASDYLPSLQSFDNTLFILAAICSVVAGVETANIFEFIGNRRFKPQLTSRHVVGGILSAGVVALDDLYGLFAAIILPHFASLPWWVVVFAALDTASIVGSVPFILSIWSRKNPRLHPIGLALFLLPVVFLTVLGALMRLGVSL